MENKCVLVFILIVVAYTSGQVTRKQNRLLSRQKRYLIFPKGSNFVMTMSSVKAVMIQVPSGINTLMECDVPFSLPSDTRIFRRHRGTHHRQRREILAQLESALEGYGFNGDACIKRMICLARSYIPLKGRSLVKDLLSTIFQEPEEELNRDYSNYCNETIISQCDLPLMNYFT